MTGPCDQALSIYVVGCRGPQVCLSHLSPRGHPFYNGEKCPEHTLKIVTYDSHTPSLSFSKGSSAECQCSSVNHAASGPFREINRSVIFCRSAPDGNSVTALALSFPQVQCERISSVMCGRQFSQERISVPEDPSSAPSIHVKSRAW